MATKNRSAKKKTAKKKTAKKKTAKKHSIDYTHATQEISDTKFADVAQAAIISEQNERITALERMLASEIENRSPNATPNSTDELVLQQLKTLEHVFIAQLQAAHRN